MTNHTFAFVTNKCLSKRGNTGNNYLSLFPILKNWLMRQHNDANQKKRDRMSQQKIGFFLIIIKNKQVSN